MTSSINLTIFNNGNNALKVFIKLEGLQLELHTRSLFFYGIKSYKASYFPIDLLELDQRRVQKVPELNDVSNIASI